MSTMNQGDSGGPLTSRQSEVRFLSNISSSESASHTLRFRGRFSAAIMYVDSPPPRVDGVTSAADVETASEGATTKASA